MTYVLAKLAPKCSAERMKHKCNGEINSPIILATSAKLIIPKKVSGVVMAMIIGKEMVTPGRVRPEIMPMANGNITVIISGVKPIEAKKPGS